MITLRFESRLAADAALLWQHAASMAGVNFELMPLVRMSYPHGRERLPEGNVPRSVLFRSWLLALGVLPFDRHALRLTQVLPGAGFDEDSTSWLQRRWVHRRRIRAVPGGASVVDELEVVPRVAAAAPLVRAIAAGLFHHRHRRLRKRFGTIAG